MSRAKELRVSTADKDTCDVCGNYEILSYTLEDRDHIRFCNGCYGNIPQYIPLDQDSQYIVELLKRMKK